MAGDSQAGECVLVKFVIQNKFDQGALACLRIPRHSPTLRERNASGGFMFAVRSRNFHFSLILAAALAVSMLPSAGQAYTPEQEQACSRAAFRRCAAEIPDVDRVTLCMIRSKYQLTPGCQAFF